MDMVLGMLGGLGLFLYGMKLMSDGLQKAAGAKMRNILETLTKNRFIGVIVGLLFTAVIQSSSATTVLVVSFVNASLMTLYQAAGVIMGANIGTTMTGQLITLNLTAIAPIFLMGGVIMVMFLKKPFVKKLGEVILGFGMLFVGLSTMSSSLAVLKESPVVLQAISSLDNWAMALFVGFLITAILQSSSATVGIVILLASQELIGLEICFYLILGCNIGSCVSACLASLSGNKMAKRAALIHLFFNVIGTSVLVIILALFKDQIAMFIHGLSNGVPDVLIDGTNRRLGRDVANAHTIFKIAQVLFLFPFSNLIVKLTYLCVQGDEEKVDEKHLKFIGEHAIYSPTTAVPQAICEIERMGNIAFRNLENSIHALFEVDEKLVNQVYETEKAIDYMNTEITDYLVKINQLPLPVKDRKSIGGLFHVVNDIERIGDHAENIADFTKMMIEDNLSFSKEGTQEIKEMFGMTKRLLEFSLEMFTKQSSEHLQEILTLENTIDEREKELQHNHVVRLTNNKCDAESGMIFSDLASNLERVADHGTNIAFSILESDPEEEIVF